jgi:hypothetical protein
MLTEARLAVERLISERAPFGEIEAYIERQPLDTEHRSALWLFAWAQRTQSTSARRSDTDSPRPPDSRTSAGSAVRPRFRPRLSLRQVASTGSEPSGPPKHTTRP